MTTILRPVKMCLRSILQDVFEFPAVPCGIGFQPMITVLCLACRNRNYLPDDKGGSELRCSACGQRISVPACKKRTGNDSSTSSSPSEVLATGLSAQADQSQDVAASDDSFYFMHQGTRYGPVSFDRLAGLVPTGELLPDDLVWLPVTKAWKCARDIPGLFPKTGVDTPLTNSDLPLMANLICIYCLVGGPVLWIINQLSCSVGPGSLRPESQFYTLVLVLHFAMAFVNLGITGFLFVGGWLLRNGKPSGQRLVLIGLCASVGFSALAFVLAGLLFVAIIVREDNPFAEVSTASEMIGFATSVLSVGEFAFVIISVIWLWKRGNPIVAPLSWLLKKLEKRNWGTFISTVVVLGVLSFARVGSKQFSRKPTEPAGQPVRVVPAIQKAEPPGINPPVPRSFDQSMTEGQIALGKANYDLALSCFDEAIQLRPKSDLAFSWRGRTWYEKRDYESAILDYTEALRLNPNDATTNNNRGNAWLGRQQWVKAIADFDQAILLDKNLAQAYLGRGIAHNGLGDRAQANADYQAAIRLDPNLAKQIAP